MATTGKYRYKTGTFITEKTISVFWLLQGKIEVKSLSA